LLLKVLDLLNKLCLSIILGMIMGGFFQCRCNIIDIYMSIGPNDQNPKHTRVVANRVVKGSVVAMLNIRKAPDKVSLATLSMRVAGAKMARVAKAGAPVVEN